MAVQVSGGIIPGAVPGHNCQEELPGEYVYKYSIDDRIRDGVQKNSIVRCSCGTLWTAKQIGYSGSIRWTRTTGWKKWINRNKGWGVPA